MTHTPPEGGGWCAPDNAYCICGQVFDETHDRSRCLTLFVPDERVVLLVGENGELNRRISRIDLTPEGSDG